METSYLQIRKGVFDKKIEDPSFVFPTRSDDFQNYGYWSIHNGHNTIVTAHTGCGKTRVAKYAIAHFVKKGKKVIYTAPVKALSNQKYHELKDEFVAEFMAQTGKLITVGIMTGDNKINPAADCVVMTTEILRNALFKLGDEGTTRKETEFTEDFINNIGCVIFDEVHYINDKDRGHVWEETICLLDSEVSLVMLSATIDRAEQFAEWIGDMKKKPINLIPTEKRVIPLKHYIFSRNKLFEIMNEHNEFLTENFMKAQDRYTKSKTLVDDMVRYLQNNDLLQTIFFSFSRANCEKYANSLVVNLLDHIETSEVEKVFGSYMRKHESKYLHSPQYNNIKNLIMKGIAYHHSGLIPVLKEIVEILFSKGLIKVLFATETFAVGVNMPTKTIVFMEVNKPTNNGRRFLQTAEYKQMAGRAGRRGLDTSGTVIILPYYNFPDKNQLCEVMQGKVPHIVSKFTINYNFLLKVILSEEIMQEFIDRSLFQRENNKYLTQEQENNKALKKKLEQIIFDPSSVVKKYLNEMERQQNLKKSGFKMSKKDNKKLKQLKDQAKKDSNYSSTMDVYNKYYAIKKEYDESCDYIHNLQSYVMYDLESMSRLLNHYNYLSPFDNLNDATREIVTMKGLIAAQVNECNSIILTEMIMNKMFDDLSAEEIVGILGIFIEDNIRRDERISRTEVNGSYLITNKLDQITQMIKNYMNVEYKLNVKCIPESYWDIYFDFVDPAYQWAKGCSLNEVFKYNISAYEGNFIKNMIKISNIASDLINLTRVHGDLTALPELEKIEGLIIRDIVNITSLYIAT